MRGVLRRESSNDQNRLLTDLVGHGALGGRWASRQGGQHLCDRRQVSAYRISCSLFEVSKACRRRGEEITSECHGRHAEAATAATRPISCASQVSFFSLLFSFSSLFPAPLLADLSRSFIDTAAAETHVNALLTVDTSNRAGKKMHDMDSTEHRHSVSFSSLPSSSDRATAAPIASASL